MGAIPAVHPCHQRCRWVQMVRTETSIRPSRRTFLSGIAGLAMVVFVGLAVTLLQPPSAPEEELYFNQRALEEQVRESTPAIPGDYFDSRNLKETDPALMSKNGANVYGRHPTLEQATPAQTSELEQEEGDFEGDTLAEPDTH